MPASAKIYFASSNTGKLKEFRALAESGAREISLCVDVELLPEYASVPAFEESALTFGENALGKALYYSRLRTELMFADDSGLVVPALGGAPGVHSARYAGENATDAVRIKKLLGELDGKAGLERSAYFSCVLALVRNGRCVAVVSNRTDGEILEKPRGEGGFGYDPVFRIPVLGKTFAQLSPQEQNQYSHRGKAFRRMLTVLREGLLNTRN